MRESYPSATARNSPAPPDLPEPPPVKFQFSLMQLLAFMFVSAILATGIRYVLQLVERLPDSYAASLVNTTVFSLAFGALAYFLVRGPFLAVSMLRIRRRWRATRQHRRDLEAWAKSRVEEANKPDESGPPRSG